MRLQDRVAIIVGAGQSPGEGIGNGRATALTFAREGARVLCVDHHLESAQETVDMIAANSTDGPIQAFGLVALDDDKHYFPPYQAVPLVRAEALRRWPQMQVALDALAGKISADDMRAMNEAVDGQHRDPGEVVREFRARKGL